jgi:hypothetical protein
MKSRERTPIGADRGPGRTRELLVTLFVLGVLLLTPPLLILFNKPNLGLGVPTLYLYLFAVWAALIVLVALVVESPHATGDLAEAGPETGGTTSEQATGESGDA